MSRGPRRRIVASNVYEDANGLRAIVTVGTLRREKRYPRDIDLTIVQTWQATTRATLLEDYDIEKAKRADARSLTRSIAVYLRRRRGRPSYKADRSHLKAWIEPLGKNRRHQITREDVEKVIVTWTAAHVKPRTIRHRARALRELYQSLDGARVRHPLEGVTLPTISRPAPVPVPASTIRKVAASLKKRLNPVHRARFLVYATTGQRPSQIGRAKPKDLDLRRRIWWVQPAKGGDPLPLPLNDEAVVAWRAFAAARAWGSFDPSTLSKILRRHGWPPGIRPYQLRHTFAIELLLGGADLGDVQGLLGHTSVLTTRQYYAPVLLQHLRSTVAKRTIGFGAKGSVPKRAGATRQNTAKSGDFRRARRTEKKDVRKRKRP